VGLRLRVWVLYDVGARTCGRCLLEEPS